MQTEDGPRQSPCGGQAGPAVGLAAAGTAKAVPTHSQAAWGKLGSNTGV